VYGGFSSSSSLGLEVSLRPVGSSDVGLYLRGGQLNPVQRGNAGVSRPPRYRFGGEAAGGIARTVADGISRRRGSGGFSIRHGWARWHGFGMCCGKSCVVQDSDHGLPGQRAQVRWLVPRA
jgi:hypothetical protein